MKTTVSILVLLFAVNLVFAQDKPKNQSPDEQIKVKRKYDDNGNLIGYDSTFVKTWEDTTTTLGGMEEMRQKMHEYFGSGMPGGMSDTTMMGSDPFGDLHEFFSEHHQNFFNHRDPSLNDSSRIMPQDSMPAMSDFDQLRQEMMDQFGQFFNNDSTQIHIKGQSPGLGTDNFGSFFDQKEFNQMRKEFERRFKDLPRNKNKAQKMGTSATGNIPTVEL